MRAATQESGEGPGVRAATQEAEEGPGVRARGGARNSPRLPFPLMSDGCGGPVVYSGASGLEAGREPAGRGNHG